MIRNSKTLARNIAITLGVLLAMGLGAFFWANSYQKDPAAFKADAKLFDAWQTSLRIAEAALNGTGPGSWIGNTENAAYLANELRRDPWNHPLCVLRRGNTLAVISGGPKATESPVCRETDIGESELLNLPRARLLETPAGNLLLVLDRKMPASASPTS